MYKKRRTRTEQPCVFQSTMCFNVLYVLCTLNYLNTAVEPRKSAPRLSGFLDYPDFFSGPNFFLIFISHDQDP